VTDYELNDQGSISCGGRNFTLYYLARFSSESLLRGVVSAAVMILCVIQFVFLLATSFAFPKMLLLWWFAFRYNLNFEHNFHEFWSLGH
jgi:hypothetical protein